MIEIITTLLNRVEEERQILLQSTETTINSLYEGGGSKQRKTFRKVRQGEIFITNIVSKEYEIVKKILNEVEQSNMSNMQTVGKQSRSTMDNIIIIIAVIDRQT